MEKVGENHSTQLPFKTKANILVASPQIEIYSNLLLVTY